MGREGEVGFFPPCFPLSRPGLWLMMGQFFISIFQTAPKPSLLLSDPPAHGVRTPDQQLSTARRAERDDPPHREFQEVIPTPRACCDLLMFLPR